MEPSSYGTILVPVLLNKLSPDVHLVISCKNAGSELKIDYNYEAH